MMLVPFLFLPYVLAQTEMLISPQFSRRPRTVSASSCDIGPLEGEAWAFGRNEGEHFATYQWPTEMTGCYLLDLFFPKNCDGITLSEGVPFELTYYEDRKWDGYFNQTKDGGSWVKLGHFAFYEGKPGELMIGGESPDYVDTDVATLNWIAPNLRVSWWNKECGMPEESPASVPEAQSDEDDFVIPGPVHSDLKTRHSIFFQETGCYLLEGKYPIVATDTLMRHGNKTAMVPPYMRTGGWDALISRMFLRDEEFVVSTTKASEMRVTFVGKECLTMRFVTVTLVGTFPEEKVRSFPRHVLHNVMQETRVESYRIIKRGIKRELDGPITVDLITFGVPEYKGALLCHLVADAPCSAKVTTTLPEELVFYENTWLESVRLSFYVFLVAALLIIVISMLLCCRYYGVRSPATHTTKSHDIHLPMEKANVGVSIVGSVVNENSSTLMLDTDKLQKGEKQFVVGRPCTPKTPGGVV